MGSYLEKNIHTFIEMQKRLQDQSRQIYGDNPMLERRRVERVHQDAGPRDPGPDGELSGAERQRLHGNAAATCSSRPAICSATSRSPTSRAAHPARRATPNHRGRRRMTAARTKAAKTSPEPAAQPRPPHAAPQPKVGFVSLGCPKALVDSERILTAAARRRLPDLAHLRGCRPRRRQHLRLHRLRRRRIARRHRRGARRKRQGDRHRLPRRQGRYRQEDPPARARGDRPACDRRSDARGAPASAATARSVREPGSAAGHQAHPGALRLSQDRRGLQSPLHVLHHSRRCAATS